VELRPDFPIRTARLLLRPSTADDVDAALRYRGDPETVRFVPFGPQTREQVAERIAGDFSRTELTAEGQALVLGVVPVAGGPQCGELVLFHRSEEHRGGELGYMFAAEARGRGYAVEASAAVLALAFEDMGMHRVIARIDARNEPSARVARRLGMRQEAHLVRNELFKGEWSDELVFALLEDEWPASPAAALASTWRRGAAAG
jgi:RimJ/RimL family protein N-acetyltransferase